MALTNDTYTVREVYSYGETESIEGVYTNLETSADQSVTPGAIATAESVFAPQVVGLKVLPNAVASGELVYGPQLVQRVLPSAIPTAEQLYPPTAVLRVVPNAVATAEQVFGPTARLQVQPSSLDDPDAVFDPNVRRGVAPDAIPTAEQHFAPTVQLQVQPQAFDDADQVFAPQQVIIPQRVYPDTIAAWASQYGFFESALYSDLEGDLYYELESARGTSEQVYPATALPTLQVFAGAIGTQELVYAPGGRLQMQPSPIATGEQVYGPTVRLQALPGAIGTAEQVYQPQVGRSVAPSGIGTAEAVYPIAAVVQVVLPNAVPTAAQVYPPTLPLVVLPDTITGYLNAYSVLEGFGYSGLETYTYDALEGVGERVYSPNVVMAPIQQVRPDLIGSAELVITPWVYQPEVQYAFPDQVPTAAVVYGPSLPLRVLPDTVRTDPNPYSLLESFVYSGLEAFTYGDFDGLSEWVFPPVLYMAPQQNVYPDLIESAEALYAPTFNQAMVVVPDFIGLTGPYASFEIGSYTDLETNRYIDLEQPSGENEAVYPPQLLVGLRVLPDGIASGAQVYPALIPSSLAQQVYPDTVRGFVFTYSDHETRTYAQLEAFTYDTIEGVGERVYVPTVFQPQPQTVYPDTITVVSVVFTYADHEPRPYSQLETRDYGLLEGSGERVYEPTLALAQTVYPDTIRSVVFTYLDHEAGTYEQLAGFDYDTIEGTGERVYVPLVVQSLPQTVYPSFFGYAVFDYAYHESRHYQGLEEDIYYVLEGHGDRVYEPTLGLRVLPSAVGTAEQVYPIANLVTPAWPDAIPSAEQVYPPLLYYPQDVYPDTVPPTAQVYQPCVCNVPHPAPPLDPDDLLGAPVLIGGFMPAAPPLVPASSVPDRVLVGSPRTTAPPLVGSPNGSAPPAVPSTGNGAPPLAAVPLGCSCPR